MGMTVIELISYLEDCDPDAEVLIMSQQQYPFENSVSGVVERSDFTDPPEDENDDEGRANSQDTWNNNGSPNDVFILEGSQLRYGSKEAFFCR